MKYKILSISFLIIILMNSCSKEEIITNSPTIIHEQGTISFSDSLAKIADKIYLYTKNINNYNLSRAYLNNEFVLSKKVSDSVYSLFIPYNAANGNFKLYFNTPFGTDTLIYSPNFTVINDCLTGNCIDWTTKEKIIETDSWMESFLGSTISWEYEMRSDTILIKRNGLCGDECGFYHTIIFKHFSNDRLPEFLFAVSKVKAWLEPEKNDTIRNAIIKIDEWNSNSMFTGTVTFSENTWIFWINNN